MCKFPREAEVTHPKIGQPIQYVYTEFGGRTYFLVSVPEAYAVKKWDGAINPSVAARDRMWGIYRHLDDHTRPYYATKREKVLRAYHV